VEMLLVHHIHLQQQLYSVRILIRRFVFMFLTKFIDFTETLSQELILSKATGVRATAVLPFYLDGGIYTTLRK
jgi:hypothetical protein